MSNEFYAVRKIEAQRVSRACDWCGRIVAKGSPIYRLVGVHESMFGWLFHCPKCYEEMNR